MSKPLWRATTLWAYTQLLLVGSCLRLHVCWVRTFQRCFLWLCEKKLLKYVLVSSSVSMAQLYNIFCIQICGCHHSFGIALFGCLYVPVRFVVYVTCKHSVQTQSIWHVQHQVYFACTTWLHRKCALALKNLMLGWWFLVIPSLQRLQALSRDHMNPEYK